MESRKNRSIACRENKWTHRFIIFDVYKKVFTFTFILLVWISFDRGKEQIPIYLGNIHTFKF